MSTLPDPVLDHATSEIASRNTATHAMSCGRCELIAPSENPNGIPSQSPGLRVPRRSAAKAGGTSYFKMNFHEIVAIRESQRDSVPKPRVARAAP